MKKPLVIKPWRHNPDAPPKKPRTEAQKRAHDRTWRIAQLRSLWVLAFWLSEPRSGAVRAIIDDELRDMGAEPHGERFARERAAFEQSLQEREIPF